MSKEDLIKCCLVWNPDKILEQYFPKAIEYFLITVKSEELSERSYKENYATIRRIANKLYDEEDDKEGSFDLKLEITTEDFLGAEKQIRKIEIRIKELRQELFGKKEPPFSFDGAVKWIRNTIVKKSSVIKDEKIQEEALKLEDEIFKLSDKFNKMSARKILIGWEINSIPYRRENGWRDEIIVFPGTPLEKLACETKLLSKLTNFSQSSLIMFTLAGIKPILPSYKLSLGKDVKLEIYRELKYKEIMALLQRIRDFFRPKGKKWLKQKQLLILNLVERHGGAPKIEKTKYWQKIMSECNEKYPGWFRGPDGPRMAYCRIMRRLQHIP